MPEEIKSEVYEEGGARRVWTIVLIIIGIFVAYLVVASITDWWPFQPTSQNSVAVDESDLTPESTGLEGEGNDTAVSPAQSFENITEADGVYGGAVAGEIQNPRTGIEDWFMITAAGLATMTVWLYRRKRLSAQI